MNEFSLRFLNALQSARHAAVRAMAAQAVEEHGAMRVSGRSPGGQPFYVTTASGNEVTVGFGRHWHTHLDEFEGGADSEEPFADVVGLLEDLVRGQVVIVEWYSGRQYAGSGARRRGDESRDLGRAGTRVTLSWTRSQDDESTVPSAD